MNSKQLSILVIFITLGFSNSQNWCEFVTPNNKYSGLGIYHRFIYQDKQDSSLIMYNRAGSQWKFQIKDYSINLVDNSDFEIKDKDFIDRFGIIERWRDMAYDCIIKKGKHNTTCTIFNTLTKTKSSNGSFPSNVPEQIVLLDPWPKEVDDRKKKGNHLLIFNRYERKEYWVYYNLEVFKCDKSTEEEISKLCQTIPKWVEEMDYDLFSSIQGIINYKSTHLILFFIDGVTKYCFNLDENELSSKCKTSMKMKVIFEECFPQEFLRPTPTPTSTSKRSYALIFFVLFVVSLVFIAIITTIILWIVFSKELSENKEEIPKE